MTRLTPLDGLRAVAVLLVVAAHSDSRFTGGGAGVAVFFVLSGYLITGLLVREREQAGRIHLRLFYARRVLRLYPALLAMLAVTVLAGASVKSAVVAATYTTNIVNSLGYHVDPYGHTWSLALEEQFYLLWPLLIPLCARSTRAVYVALATVVVASAGAAWIVDAASAPAGGVGVRAFNPLLEVHGLVIGCMLALWLRRRVVARPAALVAAGAALLAFGLCVGKVEGRDPLELGWNVLTPEVAAALLIAGLATAAPSGLGKVFAWRPLVWAGTRSYAIYLWHMPLIVLGMGYGLGQHRAALVGVPAAFVAAEISYRWVEAPFLRLKDRLHPAGQSSVQTHVGATL